MTHTEYMRGYYKRLRASRKCLNCCKPLKDEENNKCIVCKNKVKVYEAKRKKQGLCMGCGEVRDGENKTFCKKCRDKRICSVTEKRIVRKKKCIEFLGGKCSHCGLISDCVDVYDFHHRDPTQKTLSIGTNLTTGRTGKGWDKIWKEIKKCILLCANCHRILHYKLNKE